MRTITYPAFGPAVGILRDLVESADAVDTAASQFLIGDDGGHRIDLTYLRSARMQHVVETLSELDEIAGQTPGDVAAILHANIIERAAELANAIREGIDELAEVSTVLVKLDARVEVDGDSTPIPVTGLRARIGHSVVAGQPWNYFDADVVALDGDVLTYTTDRVWTSTAVRSDRCSWELLIENETAE